MAFNIFDELIGLLMVVGFSFICSIIKDRQFSSNTFLISMAIGIMVLVWLEPLDFWWLIVSAGLIAYVLFRNTNTDVPTNE